MWSSLTTGGTEVYESPGPVFEIVVSVDGQIQQKDSSNLSASTGTILIFRSA